MDFVPVENFLGEDNPCNQAVFQCLRTPELLQMILQNLSRQDLLRVSSVNRMWNSEALSVLRAKEIVTLTLPTPRPCFQLRETALRLQRMTSVKFNGISIELDGSIHQHNSPQNIAELSAYFQNFDRIQFKQLSIILKGLWTSSRRCPAMLLTKQILQRHCGELQYLTLQVDYEREQFIGEVLQHLTFPRLLSLKFGERNPINLPSRNIIRELVVRAKKLQEIIPLGRLSLAHNFLEGSNAYILADFHFDPIKYRVSDAMIDRLRLKNMKLGTVQRTLNIERLRRITPLLLQNSFEILSSIKIDAVFLAALMYYGISFQNVKQFEISWNLSRLLRYETHTQNLIEGFDFSRIFPSLNRVDNFLSPQRSRHLNQMDELAAQVNYPEPQPNRAINIRTVSLDPHTEASTINFIARVLPDVEILTMNSTQGDDMPYQRLWQNDWTNLVEIHIRTFGSSQAGNIVNLDSLFCGIHPEEVNQLRLMDDEYLNHVHIVPTLPSIVCLRDLRAFKLFYGRDNLFRGGVNDPSTMFSKVTVLTAFKRFRPALQVELTTDDERLAQALDHLRSDVSVVLVDPI